MDTGIKNMTYINTIKSYKFYGFVLLLISFILELLNIPYLDKTFLYLFHGLSTICFSLALLFLSRYKIPGCIMSVLAIIICSYLNIWGIIAISLFFLLFNNLPSKSWREILYISLLLSGLIVIFFYDIFWKFF